MWVRDRLDGLWCDEDFADWYPRDGCPGLSPAQLTTVCVLQLLLGLSDPQATEAILCRIDFKYAMATELDAPGFHHSVLADFRDRLAEGDRANRLLDLMLGPKEPRVVRERTMQRTDTDRGSSPTSPADHLPELPRPARDPPSEILANPGQLTSATPKSPTESSRATPNLMLMFGEGRGRPSPRQ